jgi:hypothetical protein
VKDYLNEPTFKRRFGSPGIHVTVAHGLTGIILRHHAVKRHSAWVRSSCPWPSWRERHRPEIGGTLVQDSQCDPPPTHTHTPLDSTSALTKAATFLARWYCLRQLSSISALPVTPAASTAGLFAICIAHRQHINCTYYFVLVNDLYTERGTWAGFENRVLRQTFGP